MQPQDVEEGKRCAVAAGLSWMHTGAVRTVPGDDQAIRRRKGQLQALCRGRKGWTEVAEVTIERPKQCPTGACDLEE